MTGNRARSCVCGYNSKCVLRAMLTWWAIYDVLLSWKGKVSGSCGSDRRVMALTKQSTAWYLSTTVLVRWKNVECIWESSLPFCHWGDIARWGERLMERLACIRMWLLIGVWEGCQSLWLSLPLLSLPLILFLHQASVSCLLYIHIVPRQGGGNPCPLSLPSPPLCSIVAGFSTLSILAACTPSRQWILPRTFLSSHPADRRTPPLPLLLSYFLPLQLSWRAKPLLVEPRGRKERDSWTSGRTRMKR